MSRYYKVIKGGMLVAIGQDASTGETITEAGYDRLKAIIDSKPSDTETHYYALKADTLEYEAVERPEPVTLETDPYTAGYDQAVLDMIESGVL